MFYRRCKQERVYNNIVYLKHLEFSLCCKYPIHSFHLLGQSKANMHLSEALRLVGYKHNANVGAKLELQLNGAFALPE